MAGTILADFAVRSKNMLLTRRPDSLSLAGIHFFGDKLSKTTSKYFTFLYVPSMNTGLKTVRVHKGLVAAFAATVLILMGATTAALIKYGSALGDAYRLSKVERENEVLKHQLSEFEEQMTVLARHVQQNFDFQKKARILANLDDLNEDVAEVGVGGPNTGYIRTLSTLDEDTRDRVAWLSDDVGKLVRQAKLQSEAYSDIIGNLSDQRKRLNGTPSIKPVGGGYLSSRYGQRMDPITGRRSFHHGIDYSARLGTPVLATGEGIITFAGKWGNFGYTVEVSHGFDYVTRYAHCSKLLVKKGRRVKRGDVIARVGNSGRSTATHLHYEVVYQGKKRNPLAYVFSGKEVYD